MRILANFVFYILTVDFAASTQTRGLQFVNREPFDISDLEGNHGSTKRELTNPHRRKDDKEEEEDDTDTEESTTRYPKEAETYTPQELLESSTVVYEKFDQDFKEVEAEPSEGGSVIYEKFDDTSEADEEEDNAEDDRTEENGEEEKEEESNSTEEDDDTNKNEDDNDDDQNENEADDVEAEEVVDVEEVEKNEKEEKEEVVVDANSTIDHDDEEDSKHDGNYEGKYIKNDFRPPEAFPTGKKRNPFASNKQSKKNKKKKPKLDDGKEDKKLIKYDIIVPKGVSLRHRGRLGK